MIRKRHNIRQGRMEDGGGCERLEEGCGVEGGESWDAVPPRQSSLSHSGNRVSVAEGFRGVE